MADETLATLITFQGNQEATFASLTTLERESLSTVAGLVVLEKVVLATTATLTDAVYFVAPPTIEVPLEWVDQRAESFAKPIWRIKAILNLPAGQTTISQKLPLGLNGEIRQIVLQTPDLAAGTALARIEDEIGGKIYESGATAQNSTIALITAFPNWVPLNGICTLSVVASATFSVSKKFTLLIYGV